MKNKIPSSLFSLLFIAFAWSLPCGCLTAESVFRNKELRRFPAVEAKQAAAVDDHYFYAVGNHAIGKYEKKTGKRVGGWEGPEGGGIIHLNSGLVLDGKLYCAHSNYPGVPNTGSIEIWDTETMKHIGSHSFGIFSGSTTWIDFYEDHWYVAFAYYQNRGGEPNRDPSWTNLVKFDRNWNRVEGWVFPVEVIEHFDGYSCSGGIFDEKGTLYCTGHHKKEIYVLEIPEAGSILSLLEIVPVTTPGQGIAWDKSKPGILYSISKSTREVIVSKLVRK